MPGSKIFVVDDDPQMRAAIAEALTRDGFSVEVFRGAAKAAECLDPSECAMVVTDVKMPGMSGLELTRRIKETASSIPVVVMTAFGTIQDAVEAMKIGAFDYLLKPFSLETLEAVVRKALEESVPVRRESGPVPVPNTGGERVFITRDPGMARILRFVREIAGSRSTVLIQGESGTGKELIARMIHSGSRNRPGPFVAVNCAAIPDGLLESELFGHEKGAFSGAVARKIGTFERANRGTLLLDEVGEMDLSLQAKLLRVLQEKEIDRIGGNGPIPVNVRIISTTNRDLKEEVRRGRFREDLFYRLNVVPLRIPPLRERKTDIPVLCEYFVKKISMREGKKIQGIDEEALSWLSGREYRGNVRELENLIERAVLFSRGDLLRLQDLKVPDLNFRGETGVDLPEKDVSMREMEKDLILKTLRKTHGNRTQTSQILGISLRTLRNKLAEYKKAGICVPEYDPGSVPRKKGRALQCMKG